MAHLMAERMALVMWKYLIIWTPDPLPSQRSHLTFCILMPQYDSLSISNIFKKLKRAASICTDSAGTRTLIRTWQGFGKCCAALLTGSHGCFISRSLPTLSPEEHGRSTCAHGKSKRSHTNIAGSAASNFNNGPNLMAWLSYWKTPTYDVWQKWLACVCWYRFSLRFFYSQHAHLNYRPI